MFHRRSVALNQLAGSTSLNLARMSGIEGFSQLQYTGIVPPSFNI